MDYTPILERMRSKTRAATEAALALNELAAVQQHIIPFLEWETRHWRTNARFNLERAHRAEQR